VRGLLVDTAHFRGNYPAQCSLDACTVEDFRDEHLFNLDEEGLWTQILPPIDLQGDEQNFVPVRGTESFTHLRFKIYPDGGVARLRVYGEVLPDPSRLRGAGEVDLAAVENGGMVVAASDMFFGHRHNLIMPGRAASMSDGWETRRRRGEGNDWVVVKLGAKGHIRRLEVDTAHFKGNYPESCSLEACDAGGRAVEGETTQALPWREVLPRVRLQAHTRHHFSDSIKAAGAVTHVRFQIYPDGGVSRLRVYGRAGEGES
jgi:allantoicase